MKLNAERVDIQIRGKQIVKGFTLEVPEEEIAHAEKFTDQIQHQTVHAVTRF